MALTFAFDIYGTLIDTAGVSKLLQEYIGDQAVDFSNQWREKQLEYSYRRGLMKCYQNFDVCTREALDYTDTLFSSSLSSEQKNNLLNSYRELPAFPDVYSSLVSLKQHEVSIFAFSNGPAKAVKTLLKNAELIDFFTDIVSTDEIKSFKPNPAVYKHFVQRAASIPNKTWLISSNSFDVLGAKSAGLQAAWLQRNPQALIDPWELEPDAIIHCLDDLTSLI